MLTYQLSLYQHKQVYANPTGVVDPGLVSAAQVDALDTRVHLMQLIPHN